MVRNWIIGCEIRRNYFLRVFSGRRTQTHTLAHPSLSPLLGTWAISCRFRDGNELWTRQGWCDCAKLKVDTSTWCTNTMALIEMEWQSRFGQNDNEKKGSISQTLWNWLYGRRLVSGLPFFCLFEESRYATQHRVDSIPSTRLGCFSIRKRECDERDGERTRNIWYLRCKSDK